MSDNNWPPSNIDSVLKELDEMAGLLMKKELEALRAKLVKAEKAIGDTQDFLKYLLDGNTQYYHGDYLMANGEHHALELQKELLRLVKET